METKKVTLSKRSIKDIRYLPENISTRLAEWIDMIELIGLKETRKIKGYHDEPLKGKRKGQRSVRLNKAYRAIYTEHNYGEVELNFIEVDEVNKHDY